MVASWWRCWSGRPHHLPDGEESRHEIEVAVIPEFVQELRASLGSDHLLWLPGVNAVVSDDRGRVLLHRRFDTAEWSFLSGILDPGEEPAAGVVREVFEETGVLVRPVRLVAVTVSPTRTHGNGDKARYLELLFACRLDGGGQTARVNDDESLEVAWFPPTALPAVRPYVAERIGWALHDRGPARFTAPPPGGGGRAG
ncbi:NUDIX domain-containing protein [Streptomyces halstedii]|uniref:NUDIX hydrolase n=1 Tax=Streptomyces halstedii TaxID=1944 RepID=UPI0034604CE9